MSGLTAESAHAPGGADSNTAVAIVTTSAMVRSSGGRTAVRIITSAHCKIGATTVNGEYDMAATDAKPGEDFIDELEAIRDSWQGDERSARSARSKDAAA